VTCCRSALGGGECRGAGGPGLQDNGEDDSDSGGTGFIGPHLTQEALRRGWKVTHFNRGKRTAGGVAGVETLIGDRKGQLDSLRGRRWGVVVDDTATFRNS